MLSNLFLICNFLDISDTCFIHMFAKIDVATSRFVSLYCCTGSSLLSITISVKLLKLDLKEKEITFLN